MKIRLLNLLLIIGVLISSSCVEKFTPDLQKYENTLVVDGMITDDSGPYTIKLANSSPVENSEYNTVSGAELEIFDDIGNSEILTEVNPGEYSTAVDGIQGVVGRKYKLKITTQNGKVYFSDYEEILPSVEIDSFYSKIEYHENLHTEYDLVGLQFYVDTKYAENENNYFMWKLENTFEYNSSFLISHIFEGHFEEFTNSDSLYTCWKTETLKDIYVSNTANLAQAQIIEFPLNYVSSEDRKLSVKYSLLVKQLSINKNAYEFWHRIDELNSEQEALYASLPYQIRGNITCDSDPEEVVLGYFMTASVSEKRIFVDRPDIDFHYNVCTLTEADFERIGWIYYTGPAYWPIYITTSIDGAMAQPNQYCIDCTKKGGSATKPEFWVE